MKQSLLLKNLAVLLILFVFGIFWLKGLLFLDPDFGWRLRTGELILGQGIPKVDPFTYTMPSFPWVDHAWSLSTVIYILHSISGFGGLSFLFSFVAMASLLITASRIKTFLTEEKL